VKILILVSLVLLASSPLALASNVVSTAPTAPVQLYCTPNSWGIVGQPLRPNAHPIVAALKKAQAGSTITLEAGDYAPFTLGLGSSATNNSKCKGGRQDAPLVIDGRGRVRIIGRDGDTVGIDQRDSVRHITFRGISFLAGRRAALMFYKRDDGKNHVGFFFEDCQILGGFDHVRGTGRHSKWGVWGHRLKNFRFVGVEEPAKVTGLRSEHAFYIQNPQGDVLIENVIGDGLGRTFVQLTCRKRDGPPGRGKFTVRRCRVSNIGLARGDNFRGGSAFTIAGRHRGQLLFEENVFRAGFDKRYGKLKPVGGVHGTGAFVAWQGGEKERNSVLILKNNDFSMAYGCGDRALVAITGCDVVRILGKNVFRSGAFQPALALEPLDDDGNMAGEPNVNVGIVPTTVYEGEITLQNRVLSRADMGRYNLWKKQD
jgi:hypothetical protein